MNIVTQNGMGIKPAPKQKASNGLELKTQAGLGLTSSNGMGLSTDKNYFSFNEYARKRRYFFGDRGKGRPKKETKPVVKPQPKPAPPPPKPAEPEVKREETPESIPEKPAEEPKRRHSFKSAAMGVMAANSFKNLISTIRLPPLEHKAELPGNSLGSMHRMLQLFND